MHLKKFSMFKDHHFGWVFSAAYDLLNVKIILPSDKDDTALMLGGKKQNFNIDYFNRLAEVLGLNEKQVQTIFKRVTVWKPKALQLIENSFLNENNKLAYKILVEERVRLFI